MQDKKNLIMYIVLIVLLIILFCCVAVVIYKSAFNNNEKVNNESDDIDTLGRRLYNYVSLREGNLILFDTEDTLTYNDLEEDEKLVLVHALIPHTRIEENEDCTDSTTGCIKKKISQNLFQRYYYRLFGRDKNINYQNYFEYIDCLECYFENGFYQCRMSECLERDAETQFVNYDSARVENGDVIITVKSMFLASDGLYKDKNLEEKIDDLNYYNIVRGRISDEEYNDGFNNQSSLNYTVFLKNLFREYASNTATYEVTFKEYDDSYYWYSTKLVD